MNEWLPMETAPLDGTKLLLWCSHGDWEVGEFVRDVREQFVNVEGTDLYRKLPVEVVYWNTASMPLAWMPLPSPPPRLPVNEGGST